MKPVPVTVTVVPPVDGPLVGETADTVGAETKVNWSPALVALVPFGVVTVTSTVPEPAGAVAVIDVALLTVTDVADDPPNWTAVAPVNPVPMMVTKVPPTVEPAAGARLVTVGANAAPSTMTVTLMTRLVLLLSTVNVSVPEKVGDGGL